jgi:hypothetical protein
MTPTAAATARPDLQELALEAWEPTKTTLHLGRDRRQSPAGRHRGQQGSFPLHDGLSVASFDRHLHQLLERLGVDVAIREDPYGVPMTTPFPNDTTHAA